MTLPYSGFASDLRRDERGATAVEFALIALLLFIVSFGIIDFGLAYGQWVMAEKATQIGVRKAVVSDFVAACLANLTSGSNVTINGVLCKSTTTSSSGALCMDQTTGVIISDCSFTAVTCTSTGCSTADFNQTAFNAIVAEMQKVDPYIKSNNVQIAYTQNGLGFVGRPNGLPVTITVTLTGMSFKLLVVDTLVGAPNGFKMPPFNATLIGEDLSSS